MKRYQTETIFKALDNYSTVLCQNIHPLHDMNSKDLKGSFTLREGNVFTRVCQSVHKGCLVPGGLSGLRRKVNIHS